MLCKSYIKKDILDNTTLLDLISKERKIKAKKEHKILHCISSSIFTKCKFLTYSKTSIDKVREYEKKLQNFYKIRKK